MTPADESDAILQRAGTYLDMHRPEHALRELSTLPAATADHPHAHFLRSVAFISLGHADEALHSAMQAVAIGGPEPRIYQVIGQAEARRGDLAAAERAYLSSLELQPEHVPTLCDYANLCISANQLDKAGRLLEQAAHVDTEDPDLYRMRVVLEFARGNDQQARRIAQEYLAAYPESPQAQELVGSTSALRGKFRESSAGYQSAAASRPYDQGLGERALAAMVDRHPLMRPVQPFQRPVGFALWIILAVGIYALQRADLLVPALALIGLSIVLVLYVWLMPLLLRNYLRRSVADRGHVRT
ncbi:tetratricopeptide repeat protein [Ruania rhizosphaerae]|uniref:tetratricopeptide repeat protein n=1 Tax=Ruania rhizosphaerae TaxID=1840413 RepID=UPI00135BF6F4|nr:tetratricopeptide repeat protein [Ruania rhizosphaerae]